MKSNKKTEFLNKSIDELKSMARDSRKEIATMQLNISQGKEKNTHLMKEKKKEIAIMKTIQRSKELEAQNG